MTRAMGFAASLMAVVAVAACDSGPPDSPLAGTGWALLAIEEGGQAIQPPPAADPPTLTFSTEVAQDGIRRRLSGSGGCNNLVGSYRTAAPDTLRLGALATTRKACEPEVMEFELLLTRVLTEVTSYAVEGSVLVMTFGPNRVRFEGGPILP